MKLPSRDIPTLTIMMAMNGLITKSCNFRTRTCRITFLLVRTRKERECSGDALFIMASFSKPMPGNRNEQHSFKRYSVVNYYVSGCIMFAVCFVSADEFPHCRVSNDSQGTKVDLDSKSQRIVVLDVHWQSIGCSTHTLLRYSLGNNGWP